MSAVGALLDLCVDVHGHFGVGVADLAHDPFDVEVVGDEGDGNVGAAQRVRRDVWERWEAAGFVAAAGFEGGFADDSADALAAEAAAGGAGDEVVGWCVWEVCALEAVEVVDDGFDEVGRHLDFADAGVGLGVGDVEVGAVWVVDAELADLEVAQLTGADP